MSTANMQDSSKPFSRISHLIPKLGDWSRPRSRTRTQKKTRDALSLDGKSSPEPWPRCILDEEKAGQTLWARRSGTTSFDIPSIDTYIEADDWEPDSLNSGKTISYHGSAPSLRADSMIIPEGDMPIVRKATRESSECPSPSRWIATKIPQEDTVSTEKKPVEMDPGPIEPLDNSVHQNQSTPTITAENVPGEPRPLSGFNPDQQRDMESERVGRQTEERATQTEDIYRNAVQRPPCKTSMSDSSIQLTEHERETLELKAEVRRLKYQLQESNRRGNKLNDQLHILSNSERRLFQAMESIRQQAYSTQQQLTAEILKLKDENARLASQLDGSGKESSETSEPMETNTQRQEDICRRFTALYSEVSSWSRAFFRVPMSRINKPKVRSHILEHARGFMYEDLLQHIGDTSFNLSFIVEAFLCNYISKNILLDPFVVFGELHDDQGMYLRLMEEAMLKKGHCETLTWRAATFTAFKEAVDRDHECAQRVTENTFTIRQLLEEEIEDFITPFYTYSINKDRAKCRDRLQKILQCALDLAVELASEPARLEIIDKSLFDRTTRDFITGDERFRGRLWEDEEDEEEADKEKPKQTIGMVIQPGFRRVGSLSGENDFLWVPAKLEFLPLDPTDDGGIEVTNEEPVKEVKGVTVNGVKSEGTNERTLNRMVSGVLLSQAEELKGVTVNGVVSNPARKGGLTHMKSGVLLSFNDEA